MSSEHEIDYEALINRTIRDFQPVKRLWPVSLRLALCMLLEASILTLGLGSKSLHDLQGLIRSPGDLAGIGALILTNIAAATLALRSSIPGREVTPSELLLLIAALCVVPTISSEPFTRPSLLREFLDADLLSMPRALALAALPWIVLFHAVRRGVPLRPVATGSLIGIAAFSFALADGRLISRASAVPNPIIWQVLFGIVITTVSALAGALWLNPVRQWRQKCASVEAQTSNWISFSAEIVFPLAISASIAALIFVLNGSRETFAPIPDFDLAIENYERATTGFRPNVPSSSIEAVLTAYVEHGMPSYMWDFSREGFKLVGGRWEHLPDGAPVTYTWFRGVKGGVICMFKQTDGFKPPSATHEEHHHLLFYEYRGFSVCLINVGGYGDFISVIVAAMPMRQFVPLVLAAAV